VSHAIHKPTDITVPPTSLWARLPVIGAVMAVVGLGATFAMLGGGNKERALFSYLWAFEVVLSIALGGLAFVLIQHVVRAGWSTVIRRVAETAMATLPVFILLFIPIATVGYHVLYPWTHEVDEFLERKRWFLSDGFWYARAALYLLIWSGLSFILYSRSTKMDSITDTAQRDKIIRSLWGISAAGILLYGLSQTFQAVDWVKSLMPHWYSTMWGVYYFAGSILAFYSFTALVLMGLQRAGMVKDAVTTEHYHDIGKFMFGHTVFWAYIGFSQFMLQWYANIPEETEFWIHRTHGGWAPVSYGLPVIHFAIPFLWLLSRHMKRNRTMLAIGAVWLIVAHCIDLYWIVMPNYIEGGAHAAGAAAAHGAQGSEHAVGVVSHFAVHWLDITALLGVAGVFLAAFGWLLNRNKVICINDPRLAESMAHETGV
jgi:hypothetical protein